MNDLCTECNGLSLEAKKKSLPSSPSASSSPSKKVVRKRTPINWEIDDVRTYLIESSKENGENPKKLKRL